MAKTAEKKQTLAERVERLEGIVGPLAAPPHSHKTPDPTEASGPCFMSPVWIRTVAPHRGALNGQTIVARKTCAECGWQAHGTFNLARRGERKAFLAFLRG